MISYDVKDKYIYFHVYIILAFPITNAQMCPSNEKRKKKKLSSMCLQKDI